LITENVILSVFEMLLWPENKQAKVENDTVEGAYVLMNKIGYLLDDRME
jgi:hypothetical protein